MLLLLMGSSIELDAQNIVNRIARRAERAAVNAVERNVSKKVEKAVDKAVDWRGGSYGCGANTSLAAKL